MSKDNKIGGSLNNIPQLGDKFYFAIKVKDFELKRSFKLFDSIEIEVNKTEWADGNKKHVRINPDTEYNGVKGCVVKTDPEEGFKKPEIGIPLKTVKEVEELLIDEKSKELKELYKLEVQIKEFIDFTTADIKDIKDNGLNYNEEGKLITIGVIPKL